MKETRFLIVQNPINHLKKIIPVIFGSPSYYQSSLSLSFPNQTLYAPLLCPKRATCSAHLNLLDWITKLIFGTYRSVSSVICGLLHSLFTSSLLCPDFPIALLSNTLSPCSSFSLRDQVSHTYKTTGIIVVLCILIFKFLDSKLEDSRFCTEL